MKIAITGLGRMGMQIARKLAEDPAHQLIAHNRHKDKIDTAVKFGAQSAYEMPDVVAAFDGQPVTLWIMLPEAIFDEELAKWLEVLPNGSTIIDGGNSDFRLTRDRAPKLHAAGHKLVDCGTSGGVWGYQNGFSMMVGGAPEDVEPLKSVFDTLAKPEGAWHHFGPSGSGHFVKMVHNAIEYGMMESLAEGYRLLHDGPYDGLDLAAAGEVWQHHSVITSWLNELSRDALKASPELDGIDGYVAESGEARWTLEQAQEQGIPLPAIQAAMDVRLASQRGEVSFATRLLAAMRAGFGGHALNKDEPLK